MVPSSIASTSMVALSVSISAITSPGLTGSPSFFSHLARLPRSMVGDKRGHQDFDGHGGSIALQRRECARSLIDVGVELGRVRLGVVGGKFGRFVDDRSDLGVDLLERFLGGQSCWQ